MKASIKFRDEGKPLLRAKVPLNILNFPFQAGVIAGEPKELSLNLSTFLESGPSLRFSYRPNDSRNPFGFIFKTGVGHFGSPANSPLTMSAEFNLIGNQNPRFFIHFKPNFGDFSLKKSHSSDLAKNLGEKRDDEGFINNGYFNGAGFFPSSPESKAAAGQVVTGLFKGVELGARTALPLRDFATVNFRWGLRVPLQEAVADEVDAVIVGRKGRMNLPLLVMNKIGIEHVARGDSKCEKYDKVAEVCMGVQKQLEVIRAENGMLGKALCDLRSDMAAGKTESVAENHHHRSKYSAGGGDWRSNGDKKKSSDAKGLGGEGKKDGLKVI